MKKLFLSLIEWLAQVAASEAGELLSVRRKAHLLEAQRYRRLAAAATTARRLAPPAPPAAPASAPLPIRHAPRAI